MLCPLVRAVVDLSRLSFRLLLSLCSFRRFARLSNRFGDFFLHHFCDNPRQHTIYTAHMNVILQKFLKFIVSKLWPWFLAYIWPSIHREIVDVIVSLLKRFVEYLRDYSEERFAKRSRDAESKSSEAEELAKNASTPEERERHEAIARVWREVAEQFREENELLKKKLSELQDVEKQRSLDALESISPSLEQNGEHLYLVIQDKREKIPQLSGHLVQNGEKKT